MMLKQDRVVADEQVAWDWAKTWTEKSEGGIVAVADECYTQNIERVEKEARRLQKIARSYKQAAPLVYFSPTAFVREVRREERIDGEVVVTKRKYSMVVMVTVCPEVIGQEGWRVVGVKVLVGDQAVVQVAPGETVPKGYYGDSRQCDHCGTFRRRNELVIVRRDLPCVDGEVRPAYAQVGKTCLQEYTGISPTFALAVAAFYHSKPGGQIDNVRHEADLQPWLEWVAMAVRLDGRYWSKAAADEFNARARYDQGLRYGYREQPTTVTRARNLWSHAEFDKDALGKMKPENLPTDGDKAEAARVRDWVLGLDPDLSTYHANLVALFRAGVLIHRLEGLAASAFAAYAREQAIVAERRARAEQRPSEYLGNQGDKVELAGATVLAVREFYGDYGVTYIYKFKTERGDVATWFSSNDCELSAGDTVRLRGTIKKLEDYRGEKQTVLTRCRVLARKGA